MAHPVRMIVTACSAEPLDLGHRADDAPGFAQELAVLVHQPIAATIEDCLIREHLAQLLHDVESPADIVLGPLVADVD
eukprot:6216099-Heterocapsa_arctica.AAC.1